MDLALSGESSGFDLSAAEREIKEGNLRFCLFGGLSVGAISLPV